MKNIPNTTHFCTHPFSGAQIHEGGLVMPCCNWDSNDRKGWPTLDDGLEKAVHHPRFQKVRNDMLNQIDTPGCRRCFENENAKGESSRTWSLEREKEWIKDSYSKNLFNKDFYQLRYLDATFSILCNLSCRMCSSNISTTFRKIVNGDSLPTSLDIDKFDLDISKLTYVKFVGGEPLMEPKHNLFIEKIVNEGVALENLNLIYHTNATKLPTQKILEVWKKCKSVQINLSIDAYGDINWKQRPGPYNWKDIENVCNKYKEWTRQYKNINVGISSVITKINVFYLQQLEEWINQFWNEEIKNDKNFFNAYCIEWPKQLSICDWHNNDLRKKEVKEYIVKLKNNKIKKHVLFWIESDVGKHHDSFIRENKKLNDYWKYDIDKYL